MNKEIAIFGGKGTVFALKNAFLSGSVEIFKKNCNFF